MGDRCTGHCCRRFWLPYDPVGLEAWRARNVATGYHADETNLIADMVIPLGPPTPEDLERARVRGMIPKAGEEGYYYTCKNLDAAGNCGVYDHRPRMCSDYPYGRPCQYRECTWDAGRCPPKDEVDEVYKKVVAQAPSYP